MPDILNTVLTDAKSIALATVTATAESGATDALGKVAAAAQADTTTFLNHNPELAPAAEGILATVEEYAERIPLLGEFLGKFLPHVAAVPAGSVTVPTQPAS